jgi:membrane protein implicated in regulation of membrane protease activity
MGRCKIDGDDWRAKVSDEIPTTSMVLGNVLVIESVESNTLIVRPKQ